MARWRLRFGLKALLVLVTLLCLWLGYQLAWIRKRQAAIDWIQQHETPARWSAADPEGVTVTPIGGAPAPCRARRPPWGVRLSGAPEVHFIHLDRAKLERSDVARLDRLQQLFPEAKGIHIEEPGFSHRWPPAEIDEFFQ